MKCPSCKKNDSFKIISHIERKGKGRRSRSAGIMECKECGHEERFV